MAENRNITIHQSLHGYNSGHKLLSCSVELTDIDKRVMLAHSDYSGSGVEKGFLSYLTGYPLPSSNFYVFAKTWYAEEMKRPGCVWTHSLLIDFTDLLAIERSADLISFFQRPDGSSNFSPFANLLSFNFSNRNPSRNLDELFYSISCELYTNTEKGLVLLSESANQYESEILKIWDWQWPRMKRSFTFSTGSLSLRLFNDKSFDCQVLPFRRERSISNVETNLFKIVDIENSTCSSGWIVEYQKTDLNILKKYLIQYGSDVNGNRANFKSLFESFILMNSKSGVTVESVKLFFEINFLEPNQAIFLKRSIVELLLNNVKDKVAVLELLLNSKALGSIHWDYPVIVTYLYNSKQITSNDLKKVFQLLLSKRKDEDLVFIASFLNPEIWLNAGLTSKHYRRIFEIKPELIYDGLYWKFEEEKQRSLFDLIDEVPDVNWSKIMIAMLDHDSGYLVEQIYDRLGAESVHHLTLWMSKNDKQISASWLQLIRDNKELFFNEVCDLKKVNKNLLRLTLETILPTDRYWKNVSSERVIHFIQTLDSCKIEPETTGIYTLFLTLCYESQIIEPENINDILFQRLHDRLKNNIIDFNSWERFKWTVGRELYGLIEQNYLSKLFNDRNKIPEWDHCEFLRRSVIAIFLKYEWDPIHFLIAVNDKDTFEKIVDFAIQISEGKKMFKALYKKLNPTNEKSQFHYKVLHSSFK